MLVLGFKSPSVDFFVALPMSLTCFTCLSDFFSYFVLLSNLFKALAISCLTRLFVPPTDLFSPKFAGRVLGLCLFAFKSKRCFPLAVGCPISRDSKGKGNRGTSNMSYVKKKTEEHHVF